mgnify:CR=1 FL=1|tara:strand:- start:806 stop:1111 length:306 start_codon:yes stop_codon:yes gene_type:complete
MAIVVPIIHKESGMIKDGLYGFSWTYLFFGFFVPLFRGEVGIGVLHLVLQIFTLGFWQLIVCFLYNKQYMTRMFASGWVLNGTEEENEMARKSLGMVNLKK